jgi:hypothetical protein
VVRGIALVCGGAVIAAMASFAWILGLGCRRAWLAPVSLVLSPVAIALAVVGAPFWALGTICGLWLQEKEGVYGMVGPEGVQLDSLRDSVPGLISWEALEEVVRVCYPLTISYQLRLVDGGRVQVDFFDDEEQLTHELESRGKALRRCRWLDKQPENAAPGVAADRPRE